MNASPHVANHPARVLIVDDERHNRDLLEVMLQPEGFALQMAGSGEEALAMVAQEPPDLILLDIMMPGLDGYKVASRIKEDIATKHIPIIMVSALDGRDARVTGLGAGVENFITKPVDRTEMCAQVRNLLRLKAHGDYYAQQANYLALEAALQGALAESRKEQVQFKDEFLSHVSHELRSPLTAIKQFTTILLGGSAGALNKTQREYQEIVLKNVRQLQSMINDLLEITRLESGKLSIDRNSLSVTAAVTDSLDTMKETARAKGVGITCQVPADLPAAHADPTRVRQILIILLDNAIKFTAAGGTVVIRARVQPDEPGFVRLEVSDTGCGVSPAVVGRLFERLYQAADHGQGSRKGLGLGLFICEQLVTRQGGRIWLEPQTKKGSTFAFTLPTSGGSTEDGPARVPTQLEAAKISHSLAEPVTHG